MTNEEKASICPNCLDSIENKCHNGCIFFESYKVMEWKDQQFKEYLEKNRADIPDFMGGTDAYAFGMKEGYVKAFDKIINELFGEESK